MNFDANYLRAIQHAVGIETKVDHKISEAKERVRAGMVNSINYRAQAKRNGKPQPMCLVPTKTRYKSTFVCLPDDDIFSGDLIECDGEFWIVIETNTTNPVQHLGMAWLCNHLFKFQNWSPTVIERWGVLDSGVYSTTETGNRSVQETDKRFGVDTRYNAQGELMMEVYKVTGHNHVARSYGNGSHLLVVDVRSDNYSPEKDNLDLLICDYIQPVDPAPTSIKIVGNPRISIGTKREYSADSSAESSMFDWFASPSEGVTITGNYADNQTVVVSIAKNYALIGTTVRLSVGGNQGDFGYVDLEVIG